VQLPHDRHAAHGEQPHERTSGSRPSNSH
jgi:hypothetical protein